MTTNAGIAQPRSTELHVRSSSTPHGCERHSHARHLADDIDDVAVEQLMAGTHPTSYTAWERREAVRRLRVDHHLTQPQIAARLRIHERQVTRDLTRAGLVAVGSKPWTRDSIAHRRATVAQLLTAGARVSEIALLLHTGVDVISRDRTHLGHSADRRSPIPARSRPELLATYGHLLANNRQEASA